MKYLLFYFFIPFILSGQSIDEPTAPIQTKILKNHNHIRQDDYYWMKRKDSKKVLKYIKQENKVTQTFYNEQKNLIDTLLQEFENRINPNEESSPFELNGDLYQFRMPSSQEYSQLLKIDPAGESVFIDENLRSKGNRYYELITFSNAPNKEYVALIEDFSGKRQYKITILNNSTGQPLPEEIKMAASSIIWAPDSKSFFYTKADKNTLRSNKVLQHIIGTSSEKDKVIFEEKQTEFNVILQSSSFDRSLFIISYGHSATNYYTMDWNSLEYTIKPFLPSLNQHFYRVYKHEIGYFILSNFNSPNKQILFSPTLPTAIEHCKTFLAHDSLQFIEKIDIRKNAVLVQKRTQGGKLNITIHNLDTDHCFEVQFDEENYDINLFYSDNYNADYFYYSYNSLTTPKSTFKYSIETNKQNLIYREKLSDSTFTPDNYISKLIWFTANDDTQIPATILYKKDTKLSSAPCLLYGYGAYGIINTNSFDPYLLSLLDRGFVYVNAYVRGDRYLGEDWYTSGKLLKKRNTLTDFISVAEQLGRNNYCDPKRLYINGASAGGLLMGSVINIAPHLFKGVIAEVPFVDIVTTMLDEKLPLTLGEYDEWGNPNDVKYYHYMLSYSPYDNIRRFDYPHLMITAGYNDTQVHYWEPLKWIAKLRALRNNNNLLFLDCDMDAGHSGGSGRTSIRQSIAKKYAFILSLEKKN